MRLYRALVIDFWREHPGEKARLAAQATRMLWDPRVDETEGRAEAGGCATRCARGRAGLLVPLFLLGASGLLLVPRPRRADRRAARLRDARGDGLRRLDALPRAVGLPARARGRRGASCALLRAARRRAGDVRRRPRPPDARDRRVRAPPAHAAAGARRERRRRELRRPRRPRRDAEPFYDALERAVRPARRGRRPAAAARLATLRARPGRRAHAPRPRGRLRRARRRARRSSRRSTTTTRFGPGRSATSSARSPGGHACIAITDALRRFNVERVGLPAGKVRRHPLRPRRAARPWAGPS